MKLYGIPNCDTVKKARRWLDERGMEYDFHDLRTDGLDPAMVNRWLRSVGADRLLNKRSTTWKALDPALRDGLQPGDIPDLLVRHPTLVKRPVLEHGDRVLVGFSAVAYDTFTEC